MTIRELVTFILGLIRHLLADTTLAPYHRKALQELQKDFEALLLDR